MPEIKSAPRSKAGTPPRARQAPLDTSRRTRGLALAAMGLVALATLAMAPQTAAESEPLMQFITPDMALGQEAPGLESPPLRPLALTTPSVRIPGTCMLSACRDPTELPGAGIATPDLGPQPVDTPPLAVERTCAPAGVACTDGFTIPGQHLAETPDLEAQGVEVPGNRLPAFCDSQNVICLGPYEVPSQTLISTPELRERPITPSAGAKGALPSIRVWVPQYEPETGNVEPTPVVVDVPLLGPLGLVLCEQGCPTPDGPDAPVAWSGPATVFLWVEDRSFAYAITYPLSG